MTIANQDNDFNVWPILIDMITSVLIIFILYSFLDQILNRRDLDLLLINKKRAAFMKVFSEEFALETRDSTVKLNPEFNYLEIAFSDKILFDRGQYTLKQEGQSILGRCSKIIFQPSNFDISRIQVEGHTDIFPITNITAKIRDNWDLSAARAIEVVRYFIGRRGPEVGHLFSANGFSEYNTITDDPSPEAQEKNRRIELRIYFQGLEKI